MTEFNYYSNFLLNILNMKLNESIIYGIEFDENENLLFTLTDYGFISIFNIQNFELCSSKLLYHNNIPVYSSYYYNNNNSKILFRLSYLLFYFYFN